MTINPLAAVWSAGGVMSGSGAILGDVQNDGLIAPGQSPGAITIQGQYTQTVSGTLGMEVGIAAHDILTITNGAVLTGTLQITLLEEYTPALEDRFRVLAYASHTGTFGTLLLPALPGSLDWEVTYEADGVYVQVVRVVQEDFYLYLPTIIKP